MNSLVPRDKEFAIQQCIEAAWLPLDRPTDWDAVIADAKTLDAEALTAELKAGEPYDRNELNALRVFRLQNKLRIALRCKKGLPQNAEHLCGICAKRHAHAVNIGYGSKCLHCAEFEYLLPRARVLGGHSTNVQFDVVTQTWGIAYQTDSDRTKTAAIIVCNFPTYEEALIACIAPDRFVQLFNRVCGAGFEADESSILPIGKLFAQNLPMTPERWRTFCNENFRSAQTEESLPFASEIRAVCRDYFKEKH